MIFRKEGEKKLKKDIEESLKKQKYSSAGVKNFLLILLMLIARRPKQIPRSGLLVTVGKKLSS